MMEFNRLHDPPSESEEIQTLPPRDRRTVFSNGEVTVEYEAPAKTSIYLGVLIINVEGQDEWRMWARGVFASDMIYIDHQDGHKYLIILHGNHDHGYSVINLSTRKYKSYRYPESRFDNVSIRYDADGNCTLRMHDPKNNRIIGFTHTSVVVWDISDMFNIKMAYVWHPGTWVDSAEFHNGDTNMLKVTLTHSNDADSYVLLDLTTKNEYPLTLLESE